MAKVKVQEKHPALVLKQRRALIAEIREHEQGLLRALEGWESFPMDQKKFLAVLPWAGSIKEACRLIGKSATWYGQAWRDNPKFLDAAVERKYGIAELTRYIGADMMSLTFLGLTRILEPGENGKYEAPWSVVADMIKHVHRINRVIEDAPTASQYIDKRQITMFKVDIKQDDRPELLQATPQAG